MLTLRNDSPCLPADRHQQLRRSCLHMSWTLKSSPSSVYAVDEMCCSEGLPPCRVHRRMQFWDKEALLVRPTIRKPSDLIGMTLAAPAGSTSHYQLLYFLKILNLSNTVTVQTAQPSELAELWRAGEIDGAFVWAPHLHALRAAFDAHTFITGSAITRLGAPTAIM